MYKCVLKMLIVGACMLTGSLYAESHDKPNDNLDPKQVRDALNKKFLAIRADQPEVWNVRTVTLKDKVNTPLRIYTPNGNKDLPVILYIHGGAWVGGNLDTHDNLARYLCSRAEAVVVSVGYLNAPEAKFPFSLEQCYSALLWVQEHAQELKVDMKHLAVVGDSAGGGMAAALCLLARDRKGPQIALQVLINPVVDNTLGGTLQPQGDALDLERWYVTQYVMDPKDAINPLVSPGLTKDLTHLPTTLVVLGEKDLFRLGAQKYADRLSASGVNTNVYTQWGVGHLAGDGARASKRAQESLDVAVAALRGAFLNNNHK